MNEKVLRILEYHKVLEQLSSFATSKPGKQLCLSLEPDTDLARIILNQTQTKNALDRLYKKETISFSSTKEIVPSIKRLKMGSILSQEELLHIAQFLNNVNHVKAYARKETPDIPDDSLDPLFDILEPLTNVSTEILRCIISEEEISDDATPALRQIRRNIKLANDRIHSQLSSMVNSSYKTYLQESVITMRNNRYCIPVKSEYKNQVQGMIHDQSSSGSTLFIEPAAIVKLNNDLKELALKEEQEIEIILSNLTVLCEGYITKLSENYETMIQLDFIFAKAHLAMMQKASFPLYNKEGKINLRKARHPLLDPATVVPTDVYLGDQFDLLIITGPNTGGKTVVLKTLGLLTLMGQSGLHIPTLDRSELSVFTEVFADIGDEQSIEQSLSTFSSHMTNIVSILDQSDEHSLCLFDELGAGTDPTEGAALAIAILSDLHAKGIRTAATTHYSELKLFALSTPKVENASCEFDINTLRPTYKLLIGVPGKSNAFAISKKLGLPDRIIDEAKLHLTEQDEKFEDIIANLERTKSEVEKEKLAVTYHKQEVEKLQKELQYEKQKVKDTKSKIISEANEEARSILKDAKDYADETIRNFNKFGAAGQNVKAMEQERQNIRKKLSSIEASHTIASKTKDNIKLKPSDLRLGESVRIISMNLTGTVNSLPDTKGNLFVQCGILRTSTNINELELVMTEDITGTKVPLSKGKKMNLSKSSTISAELNLLGMTVDDALARLDKYLDDAYLSHLQSVRIVHGKGTGALRNGVHQHLKRVKYVKEFHLGAYGEGDAGVTIVTFK
ncbi:MAG: endonuclease MutS2 [Clostridia bacterium]|nr:endonuclease MutS2 [Clostridia bacterium]